MSILAYVTAAIAAKLIPPKIQRDIENACLQARVDDLERQLQEARTMRDSWEAIARSWWQRYEILASPEGQPTHQLAHQVEMTRYYRERNGLLAQQAPRSVADDWEAPVHSAAPPLSRREVYLNSIARQCNCVPARHDTFLPSGNRL